MDLDNAYSAQETSSSSSILQSMEAVVYHMHIPVHCMVRAYEDLVNEVQAMMHNRLSKNISEALLLDAGVELNVILTFDFQRERNLVQRCFISMDGNVVNQRLEDRLPATVGEHDEPGINDTS